MTQQTFLDGWSQQCKALLGEDSQLRTHPIHPCVIDGKPHYVHAPELPIEDREFYDHLRAFAARHNVGLKADQRRDKPKRANGQRRIFVHVVFLTINILSANVQAEQVSQQLGLMAADPKYEHIASHGHRAKTSVVDRLEHTVISQALQQILLNHMETGLAVGMRDDVEELSLYYSQYPAVVALLTSIAGADWRLRYAPHTFQTKVNGSRLKVEEIEVFFDPRSGARLKFYDKCATQKPFCVASPADALLHELLHVQTITQDTANFIRQGGLDPTHYPAVHERFTIQKENQLYAAMTAVDGRARPIRSEHHGRHVLVSCATCLD